METGETVTTDRWNAPEVKHGRHLGYFIFFLSARGNREGRLRLNRHFLDDVIGQRAAEAEHRYTNVCFFSNGKKWRQRNFRMETRYKSRFYFQYVIRDWRFVEGGQEVMTQESS